MEVGVRVEAEDLIAGKLAAHTNSCYLTFVAVDKHTGAPGAGTAGAAGDTAG